MTQPKSFEQYLEWARDYIASDFGDPRVGRLYEVNLQKSYNVLSRHPFFAGLQAHLEVWEREYKTVANSRLFMEQSPPELLLKPFESAVEKSFRANVLWNENFPDSPKHGWVTTSNLHCCFNDLVRCSIVCRFIDGPRFVTDRLMAYAKDLKLESRRYSQERDEGYYAYHFYVRFPVRLIDSNWEEELTEIEAEIQVTTQLQDVLRSLTHSFYGRSRISSDKDISKWKWDFKSNRFRVGYLSHTLHLLESIILDSRDEVARAAEQDIPKDEE